MSLSLATDMNYVKIALLEFRKKMAGEFYKCEMCSDVDIHYLHYRGRINRETIIENIVTYFKVGVSINTPSLTLHYHRTLRLTSTLGLGHKQ
jgi:hypothetical protein